MGPIKGFYESYIFPPLLHFVMSHPDLAKLRKKTLSEASGTVLEIGIGSGCNLSYYGKNVKTLIGLEPSDTLRSMATKKISNLDFNCELFSSGAEKIEFQNNTFDTIVLTWTLCSISNVEEALSEIKRTLKPDGKLLFVEHGKAADGSVFATQNRLNKFWKSCAGGCNLNRDIKSIIENAGFEITLLKRGHMVRGPQFLTYFYQGLAFNPH